MKNFLLDPFVFKLIFQRQRAGTDSEYWWAPTFDRDGYIVVWFDEEGIEVEHLHTYRYPPDVWGE